MLDSAKYNLRNKLTKCVEDGTVNLNTKINSLESKIAETSTSVHTLEETIQNLASRPTYYDFISLEYVLAAVQNTTSKYPRVLICGFYGARNLGDELMLQSVLKRLSPKLDVTIMLAPHLETDTSIYAPYKVIHYPQKNDDILFLAQNYDYIIWGGGAVLDDEDYTFNYCNNSLGYILLKTSLAAFKYNRKVFVLGVSTNFILKNSFFLKDLQTVIDNSAFFSLRDTNSLETLKNAKINTRSVRVINDLAIADLPTSIPHPNNNALHIGLVYIFNETNLPKITTFTKLIVKNLAQKPATIHLIPFYDHGNFDQKYFSRLLSELNLPNHIKTIIEPFSNNIDELTKLFSSCDLICSMRYHATLISSFCGIKTLSLNYGYEHRHYANKLAYIKEHYNDFVEIPFADIDNPAKVTSALKTVAARPIVIFNSHEIDTAAAQLSDILKQIR